ncbi:hypothetical protein [Mycobacterium kyogaense]|uniref:hypothetical protein n=1 Tax=Mycobacterium kyogaense TaxID=2212479 RepID=UPI000DADA659|nr:hypothetical protein [Mycobacterium kyogaense]
MADIPFERHTLQWWDRLNDDQRARVKDAAERNDTSAATAKLLADTQCPVGLMGAAWEGQDMTFNWSRGIRQFVIDQP